MSIKKKDNNVVACFRKLHINVRYEVLTDVKMTMFFWVMTPHRKEAVSILRACGYPPTRLDGVVTQDNTVITTFKYIYIYSKREE